MENAFAFLNILNARLPEEIENVNLLDFNIAQAVAFQGIPEYAVNRRACLKLVPPGIAVNLLEAVSLENNG